MIAIAAEVGWQSVKKIERRRKLSSRRSQSSRKSYQTLVKARIAGFKKKKGNGESESAALQVYEQKLFYAETAHDGQMDEMQGSRGYNKTPLRPKYPL